MLNDDYDDGDGGGDDYGDDCCDGDAWEFSPLNPVFLWESFS